MLILLVLLILSGVFCGHKKAQELLSQHYACQTNLLIEEKTKILSESEQSFLQDLFLMKYFIQPSHQILLSKLQAKMVTSNCPQIQPDMQNILLSLYPHFQKDFMTEQQVLEQVMKNSIEKDLESLDKKRKIYSDITQDLQKYHFFVRQIESTNKLLSQFTQSCRMPASVKKHAKECQRSYSKLAIDLKKEQDNLQFNYSILIEKWNVYKDWIDQQIVIFKRPESR